MSEITIRFEGRDYLASDPEDLADQILSDSPEIDRARLVGTGIVLRDRQDCIWRGLMVRKVDEVKDKHGLGKVEFYRPLALPVEYLDPEYSPDVVTVSARSISFNRLVGYEREHLTWGDDVYARLPWSEIERLRADGIEHSTVTLRLEDSR